MKRQGNFNNWTTFNMEPVGVPGLFPNAPEPEFIDINENNISAVIR